MTTQQKISNKALQTEIDIALSNSGLPLAEITNLINLANKRLQCDAECEHKKKIAALKKSLTKSEDLYNTIPTIVAENEKNYFIAAKGEQYYTDNILTKKYQTQVNTFIRQQQANLSNVKQIINVMLLSYSGETIAISRIKQLFLDVKNKNDALKNDIDQYYKNTLTAERRVYYEDQNVDNLEYYNNKLKIAYFILVGLYILFGGFFWKGQYKRIGVWIYLIIYLAFPWMSKYIIEYFSDL